MKMSGRGPCSHFAMSLLGVMVLGLVARASAENTDTYEDALERYQNDTKPLTELDLKCMGMIGVTTTTTSRAGWASDGQRRMLEQRTLFRQKSRKSGKQLAGDFSSWLVTRLVIILCSLTLGTPLVVLLLYQFSPRVRKWASALSLGRCTKWLMLTLLVAGGLSIFFAMRILDTTDLLLADMQEYFLSSFMTRFMDLAIEEIDAMGNFSMGLVGKTRTLSGELCNPTDGHFELQKFDLEGYLEGSNFLSVQLPEPLHLKPESLGMLAIQYTFLKEWFELFIGGAKAAFLSFSSNYGMSESAKMQVWLLIKVDCMVRDAGISIGIRCNLPLVLSKLPEVSAWNQVWAEDPQRFWADLYEAVNSGLDSQRFLEWDSLELGGGFMAWVYGTVITCSAILASSIFFFMLLLLKSGLQCRMCRSRTGEQQLSPVCPDSVWGRSAFDLEIEIAEEQRQQKPHLTKAVSQSRLEAT
ncbi:unnamed protein product [Durusdinium trenchii]|uniref:Transmembrane protein n=1 Tax=Durusdinium trenchii TaxID=1381693 RepID=A0ABP0IVW7_9DINO